MASKAITIKNHKEAIDKGIIPGSFNKERTEFVFKSVESVNSRKKKIIWIAKLQLLNKAKEPVEIKESYIIDSKKQLPDDWSAKITVDSKQEGGKTRDIVPTFVTKGKNIGKANATNIVTQGLRDALSLYNKQNKKSNPSGSKADSDSDVNSRLMPPPMTLKKIDSDRASTLKDKDFADGITVQRKYDGVRVVAYYDWIKKEVAFYSRSGHSYPGMDHIRKELKPILENPPAIQKLTDCPTNPKLYSEESRLSKEEAKRSDDHVILYLDGEFYLHGKPLNFISGQSRGSESEAMLEYHVYDCFFPTAIGVTEQNNGDKAKPKETDNLNSRCRQKYLDMVFEQLKLSYHVRRVENFKVDNNKQILELRDRFIKEGYEGAVARKDMGTYEYSYNGYHSSNVVKVKKVHDDEFRIVGFTQGKKGKDVGALIWEAEVDEKNAKDPNDRKFNAVPKSMSYDERRQMFKCLSETVKDKDGKEVSRFARDFLGKPLTIEHAGLSAKTGKPLQPKAITTRTYAEGPNSDPMKDAYERCKVAEGGKLDITPFCTQQINFV